MANALGEFLGGVASAIREMTDIPPEVKMKPAEFADKIRNIEKGVDVSGVTATAGDVLEGKSIVDANGNVVEGTMPNRTGHNGLVTPNRPSFPIEKGYHDGNTKISAMSTTQTVTPRKEEIIVNGDYYDGSTGSEVKGQYFLTEVTVKPIPDKYQDVSGVTATENDVLQGKTFVDSTGAEQQGIIVDCGSPVIQLTPEINSVDVAPGYYGGGRVFINPEEKTVTPTKEQQTIVPSEGNVLTKVTVEPMDESMFDVSEVTANAEDVLEGKVIVTSTGNKVYGALAVDNLAPGEVIVYKKKKVSGFALDSTYGAFSPGYVSPSEFTLEGGKSYRVIWDGAEWNCEAFAFEMSGMSIVAIGNASSLGLSGNNEPFLITYNVTANNTQFLSTEQKAEHTIGIYTEATSEILLQEKTVTENGVVEPDEGFDGLSKVTVDVQSGGGASGIERLTILPQQTITPSYNSNFGCYRFTLSPTEKVQKGYGYVIYINGVGYIGTVRTRSLTANSLSMTTDGIGNCMIVPNIYGQSATYKDTYKESEPFWLQSSNDIFFSASGAREIRIDKISLVE